MKKLILVAALAAISITSNAQTQVAHYDFSNITSGTLTDVSPTGNMLNGTIMGPVTPATGSAGVANTAMSFNGTSNSVRIPSNPALNLRRWTLSVSALFNQFNNSTFDCQVTTLLERGTQGGNDHYRLEVNDNNIDVSCGINTPTGKQFFGVAAGAGPAFNSYPKTNRLSTGTWYCLTATYANNVLSTYVNGTLFYSVPWTDQYANPLTAVSDLLIGRSSSNSNPYWFNGIMDDVQIWDDALTPAQIASVCAGTNPPTGPCSINDIQFCSSLSTPFTYTFTPSTTVATGLPPVTIRWTWGDGTSSTSTGNAPVTHTYVNSGNFYICAATTFPCTPITERCFSMCLSSTGAKPAPVGAMGDATGIMSAPDYDRGIGSPYPNPANSILNIPVKKIKGTVKMKVTGVNGAVMMSREAEVTEATSTLKLETEGLAPGIYLLEIYTGGEKIVKRFSKL